MRGGTEGASLLAALSTIAPTSRRSRARARSRSIGSAGRRHRRGRRGSRQPRRSSGGSSCGASGAGTATHADACSKSSPATPTERWRGAQRLRSCGSAGFATRGREPSGGGCRRLFHEPKALTLRVQLPAGRRNLFPARAVAAEYSSQVSRERARRAGSRPVAGPAIDSGGQSSRRCRLHRPDSRVEEMEDAATTSLTAERSTESRRGGPDTPYPNRCRCSRATTATPACR